MTAPPVTFTEVEKLGPHESLLHGFSVDMPCAGASERSWSVPLLGWALGRDDRVERIEVSGGRGLDALLSLPAVLPRPDLEASFPGVPGAGACGFEGEVGAVTLPRRFELIATAVTSHGARLPLAVVHGERIRHDPRSDDGIQPLMITTTGRSGSTWLTALLGRHPEVLAHLPFAYDWRIASYWLEALRSMTHPSSYLQQVLPDISSSRWWLGERNTSYHLRDREDPDFEDWLGTDEVERTVDMFLERIRQTYAGIARWIGSKQATFAIEKCFSGHFVPPLVWELFPSAREVFLVRDFRDVACSVIAFSAKTRASWSRPRGADSDADYVRLALGPDATRLVSDWKERGEYASLVRYEDLIRSPEETLTGLFSYLGVDSSPRTVSRVIREAAAAQLEAQHDHRTSSTIDRSIGRWRRDIQPDVLAACQETLGDPLRTFGYDDGAQIQ